MLRIIDSNHHFESILPLPTGHTTEIIATGPFRGGFFTRDAAGITRLWTLVGHQKSILPPVGAIDYAVFPSVGGGLICRANLAGVIELFEVGSEKGPSIKQDRGNFPLLKATGRYREEIASSWLELVTCGFAPEAGQEILVGTSSGTVYRSLFNRSRDSFQSSAGSLRPNDGFPCRAITTDAAGNLFAVLQNGMVEQLTSQRGAARRRMRVGGYLREVRVNPQGQRFAAVKLGEGGVASFKEEDEVILCEADGTRVHEVQVPRVAALALGQDKMLIATEEGGLVEFDIPSREIAPLFENDPWPEEFTVTSLALVGEGKYVVVGAVDATLNNAVLQVWEWEGRRVTEDSRHIEILATLAVPPPPDDNVYVGTSSGGVWVAQSRAARPPKFFSVPSAVEAVQLVPVNPSMMLYLGNHNHRDIELEENSGIAWSVDLTRLEVLEEIETYEPIIGGSFSASPQRASIFSRGSILTIDPHSLKTISEEQVYSPDDPDLLASSITPAGGAGGHYVGTERGEVFYLPGEGKSQKVIDKDHGFGPIECLALGPNGAPLLIAGFYRVLGIFWPQNRGFKKIFGQHSAIKCIAPHPSLPLFAAGALDGQVHVFDYDGNKITSTPPRQGKVIALAWQSDTKVTTGYAPGEVGSWELSLEPLHPSGGSE